MSSRVRYACLVCLAVLAIVLLTAWRRGGAAAERPTLVRVGGEANPCQCTHRIEP
jgi:hypothetical protein